LASLRDVLHWRLGCVRSDFWHPSLKGSLLHRKKQLHIIYVQCAQVVSHPMDLSTTKEKIDRKEYNNLMEFKADIKLICVNAMNYNHPDTIYYKVSQSSGTE